MALKLPPLHIQQHFCACCNLAHTAFLQSHAVSRLIFCRNFF